MVRAARGDPALPRVAAVAALLLLRAGGAAGVRRRGPQHLGQKWRERELTEEEQHDYFTGEGGDPNALKRTDIDPSIFRTQFFSTIVNECDPVNKTMPKSQVSLTYSVEPRNGTRGFKEAEANNGTVDPWAPISFRTPENKALLTVLAEKGSFMMFSPAIEYYLQKGHCPDDAFTLIVPALEHQKHEPDPKHKVMPNVDTRWNFTLDGVTNLVDDYHPRSRVHLNLPGKKKEFDRSEPEL